MTPKHHDEVKREVEKLLKAGILTQKRSAWSFLVVLTPNKDRSSQFCVEYRQLNRLVKPDR